MLDAVTTSLASFQDLSIVLRILLAITLALAVNFASKVIKFIFVYFLRPGKNLRRYGEWAIVTGCTDGIGKAIVEEFARKKLNVVLISRTLSKLQEQAKEIESKFNVQTRVIAIDFSADEAAAKSAFANAQQILSGLDIGILVNNVGMSYDHAEYYTNLDHEKVQKLIRVNIWGTIEMTNIVLPDMIKRKRGAIINVSSASSLVNEPLYAVYSATKAFVNNYSVALYYENREHGVHVQAQLPAFVATKLSKIRKTSFFVCSPRGYAKSFVSHIGYEPIITSYWTHALQIAIGSLLPASLLSNFLLKNGKSIRRRALAKKKTT